MFIQISPQVVALGCASGVYDVASAELSRCDIFGTIFFFPMGLGGLSKSVDILATAPHPYGLDPTGQRPRSKATAELGGITTTLIIGTNVATNGTTHQAKPIRSYCLANWGSIGVVAH